MPHTVPEGWNETQNALGRSMECAGFIDALALIIEIGKLAEVADHHPDIDLRYRTIRLHLSTHSAGGTVTEKDFALAQQINDLSTETIRQTTDDLRRRFQA
jgi:4a-hydroxytetrahydrobiopterin dehydratase